jgi:hypothetical protein
LSNLVPTHYRSVSVADVDVALDAASLAGWFLGREAYRRTGYIVARHGGAGALISVTKASGEPLFSPIVSVDVVAGPEDCALVESPETDVGIPTQLAAAAGALAPGARCVVVTGRYRHVSFILEPAPLPVRVVEVAPPLPAKLLDQAERLLAVAEELPPLSLVPQVFDLTELAAGVPAARYLFPCRGSGAAPRWAEVAYLDERPPRQPWVLVGCARSRQLHRWFYGPHDSGAPAGEPGGEGPEQDSDQDLEQDLEQGPEVPTVDMCPRQLARAAGPAGPTLTKCCLIEEGIECDGETVVVPWGASLDEVRAGLREVARIAAAAGERAGREEPGWVPG